MTTNWYIVSMEGTVTVNLKFMRELWVMVLTRVAGIGMGPYVHDIHVGIGNFGAYNFLY